MIKVNNNSVSILIDNKEVTLTSNNNDLYISLNTNKYKNIIIVPEEEIEIHKQLGILFNDIKESNILPNNIEFNKKQSTRKRYKDLYNKGIITIKDDLNDELKANSLSIEKKDNNYYLTFIKNDENKNFEIVIKSIGSRYNPYNLILMRFYKSLLNINLNDYQISLEDYL